jgi:hypothetical protein
MNKTSSSSLQLWTFFFAQIVFFVDFQNFILLTYAYLVGHHTQFSILKYEADTPELTFYSITTTKTASWAIFINIPTILASFVLYRRKFIL